MNKCEICGASFKPELHHPNQKFCSAKCRDAATLEQKRLKTWFKREWAAWNRDFKLGKTQSNIKEVTT